MKFDFSEGEWKIEEYNYKERYVKCNDNIICQFHDGDDNWEEFENHESNARLISCAPDMIQFIYDLRSKIENFEDLLSVLKFIKNESDKIIEKATDKKWSEINK